jgi:hypothetical protein
MPTLFKPKAEDDYPLVGVYKTIIRWGLVIGLLAVISLTIILGKGLY